MKPGAYVIGRSLNESWPASMGTHQFIVLVPEDPYTFGFPVRDLGDGTQGMVLGAYNVKGRLKAEQFAASDTELLRRYLAKEPRAPKMEVQPVNLVKGTHWHSTDGALGAIVRAYGNYRSQEMKRPIAYPDGLAGQFADGCLNSNSWAQSLIAYSVGTGAVVEDFDGIDTCNTNRIDSAYFTSPLPAATVKISELTVTGGKMVKVSASPAARSTLSGIAQEEYGDPELWPILYDLNQKNIGPNPNRLLSDLQLLVLPITAYTPAEIADAKRRAPKWKKYPWRGRHRKDRCG